MRLHYFCHRLARDSSQEPQTGMRLEEEHNGGRERGREGEREGGREGGKEYMFSLIV